MTDARTPVRGAVAPRPGYDRGTLLAGALLAAVAALAWALLVAQASGTSVGPSPRPIDPPWAAGRGPALITENRDPVLVSGERAVAALRSSLRARGLPGGVADGAMSAVLYDAQHETDGSEGFRLRGAWLVSSGIGQWWVWNTDAATPADEAARAAATPRQTPGIDAETAMAGAALIPMRPATDPTSRRPADSPAPPARAGYEAAVASISAATTVVSPLLPLASSLAGWALVLLAVVLPGMVPVLAAYGAAHRTTGQARGSPSHALLFALPATGLWLAAGVVVLVGRAGVLAASASSPVLAARLPDALAVGLGVVALHRLSPLHEGALRASRRSAARWAGRAAPGCRGTLAAGWSHGVASVEAGAGLVSLLVLGAAALPAALAVALLLFAERVLPRGDRTARVGGVVLLALTPVAAAWPAPALATLRGTIAPHWPGAVADEAAPPLRLLRTLEGHAAEVTAIAFSPDGALLASASPDGTVRLWEAASGRGTGVLRRDRLRSDGAAPISVALSRAGALVAVGDLDGMVEAWDTATGRALSPPPRRARPASALALHPHGATVAIGYADGVVVLWDPRHGREVLALPPREATFTALAFSPDGRTLAIGGRSDTPLTLRDAATGREGRTLAHDGAVRAVRFSPDGGTVAAAGQETLTLWDAGTGVVARRLPVGPTGAVGFSPDGAVLTAGGLDGLVRSWDVATGRTRGARRVAEPVRLIALAPGHSAIATTHGDPYGSDTAHGTTVKLWDDRADRS